ncbi:UDP-3-O-(3-hydroxymyristoyl)glucosamine N-acyltransferase [candidate division KSB1 bacterium]|nr:UDP-3-O-(3-hydroxymyristoyl)glucosamine N-acyltransferase [candidate division KSB1 bacterium]
MSYNLKEIAKIAGASIEGDAGVEITGLAKIEEAGPGQLTFIANPKYEKYIHQTRASAILVADDFPKSDKTLLRCKDPYFAFLTLAQKLYGMGPSLARGVHPTAIIGEGTQVGKGVAIGAYVVIGERCHIGDDVQIYPGVVLSNEVAIGKGSVLYANVTVRERCRIGERVIVHMGGVIGSDGFGFAFHEGRYHKIPQTGIVLIEDDVEIGANTTIDRATLGATIIRRGTKLDNLIQVAHNVEIGEHTVMAAQTGIAGSTKIGNNVRFGGQVGIAGHIEVGDNVTVGAQSGIDKNIPSGAYFFGYPARSARTVMRELSALTRLPELLRRVKKLEEIIESLTEQLQKQSAK